MSDDSALYTLDARVVLVRGNGRHFQAGAAALASVRYADDISGAVVRTDGSVLAEMPARRPAVTSA